MPVEPLDLISDDAEKDSPKDRLNSKVALTVALLATVMAIYTIKDDNIVQAMQQAQADKLDHWAWYQATKVRIDVDETALAQMELQERFAVNPAVKLAYRERMDVFRKELAKQEKKRMGIMANAEQNQKDYDRLGLLDDQFDLAEAALSIAISLLAVTALTQKSWLFWVALVPGVIGVVVGLAAFWHWNIHPDFIIQLLV